MKSSRNRSRPPVLRKAPSGIEGLDEITNGGLPYGRPTLLCGSAGCGKTLMAMEFLVRGAMQFDEPGVFMAFEETESELATNVSSLGFDLQGLAEKKKLLLDYVRVERSEIEETGEYDLEGLFVRLSHAIEQIGARRVVLDTIETLFSGLPNPVILRAELRRLFRWLKDRELTTIITAERGGGQLTRQGLEEYVSDCVILLDHRVDEQVSTRRLRVVKYRGSTHGTNEYPFLIDEHGITILPITSLGLQHDVSGDRISSGVPALDEMLGGGGFYRGTSVLVSGTAGTGKSSLASSLANAACARGEKVVYFAFEESPAQILRNMRSIGLDLEPWIRKGLLDIHASRPSLYGLEMHLVSMHKLIRKVRPDIVIVDPVSNLIVSGNLAETRAMLVRLIDFLKTHQITAFLTSLTSGGGALEETEVGISSLIDTWILLRDVEISGERNRVIHVLKSRGMAHSNQVREFRLTSHGIELVEVYLGPAGVLTGSARVAQEARDRRTEDQERQEAERRQLELQSRRKALQAQIASVRAELAALEEDVETGSEHERRRLRQREIDREALARSRRTPGAAGGAHRRKQGRKEA